MRVTVPSLLCGVLLLIGCGRSDPSQPPVDVAVTSPYLAAVVRDLLGPDEPIFSLMGPGCCPGHFDISPRDVVQLRRCRVLLRFDFQKYLDQKLQKAADEGLRIVPVRIVGGLCEPDSYRSACRQVVGALVEAGLLDHTAADARLAEIDVRVAAAAKTARNDVIRAGLARAIVLAGDHQAKFCRWLGLEVAATFSDADNPGQINRAVQAGRTRGVALVIGNVPQGPVIADRLAVALGAKVVMFDNFPFGEKRRDGFDKLLRRNVKRLIDAGGCP